MKHPKEEELIAYHDGETAGRETIAAHLGDCPECQAELGRIDALLAALNTIPCPIQEKIMASASGSKFHRAAAAAWPLVGLSFQRTEDRSVVRTAPLGGRRRDCGARTGRVYCRPADQAR